MDIDEPIRLDDELPSCSRERATTFRRSTPRRRFHSLQHAYRFFRISGSRFGRGDLLSLFGDRAVLPR
jgi:hypothetical protein